MSQPIPEQPVNPVSYSEIPPPPGFSPDVPAPAYQAPAQAYPAQPSYATPAQPYGQPQPYAAPGYYAGPNPATSKNWMNLTAMILGIANVLTWITWLPAIIFGHLGRRAAKRGEASNAGMGLAGLILGYVGGVLTILGVAAYIIFIVVMVDQCGGDAYDRPEWCDSSSSYDYEYDY